MKGGDVPRRNDVHDSHIIWNLGIFGEPIIQTQKKEDVPFSVEAVFMLFNDPLHLSEVEE
jgi:hypothetical protein